MIAGVCQGVADHFNVDPLIVRIAFVVAAVFGGAGAIAYVAAWLLIPEEGCATSIGEHVIREHRWGRIAGIVLIVIAISSLARPVWWAQGGVVWPVLLIIGGLFLLTPGAFDRRDSAVSAPRAPTAPVAPTTTDAPPPSSPPPPTTLEFEPPLPPPPPERRRRRGGIGSLTLGLLFVGAGIVGFVVASGNSVEPTYVFAGGLLIVGLALVITTWFGRSYILIPLGVLLVALMSVSSVVDVPLTGGVGERRIQPLTLADLHDDYHLGIGELRLDLTHLNFERGSTHTLKITVGVGQLRIALPRQVTAELHGHAGLGQVQFLDQHEGGFDVDRDTTLTASGELPPRLVIEAEVGIGQVWVEDATA